MVTCDLFEMNLAVKQKGGKPYLVWSFVTDLPARTQVILSCSRTFLNMRGDTCVWTGHNERLEVQPNALGDYNGTAGRIDVDDSDQKALDLFNEIHTAFSSGVKTPVSDELTLCLTVGARQRLRAFGRNNSDLSGHMVSRAGDINKVEICKSVVVPMQDAFQPVETES